MKLFFLLLTVTPIMAFSHENRNDAILESGDYHSSVSGIYKDDTAKVTVNKKSSQKEFKIEFYFVDPEDSELSSTLKFDCLNNDCKYDELGSWRGGRNVDSIRITSSRSFTLGNTSFKKLNDDSENSRCQNTVYFCRCASETEDSAFRCEIGYVKFEKQTGKTTKVSTIHRGEIFKCCGRDDQPAAAS